MGVLQKAIERRKNMITHNPIMQALAPFPRVVAAGSQSLSLACLFMVNYIFKLFQSKKHD